MSIHQFHTRKTCIVLLCTMAALMLACKKDDKPAPVAPSDPTGLTITDIRKNTFTVSWNAIPGVNYFFLSIATDSAFAHPVAGFNQKAVIGNSQTVTNLQKATKYYVKIQSFNDGLRSNSLVTNGTTKDVDVFITGYISNSGYLKPGYWKNGVHADLWSQGYPFSSNPNGIFVSNDDIYVVASNSSVNTAVYWKNGNYISLPSDSAKASGQAIFVTGNDVYVAGYQGVFRAMYWKNGTKVNLGDPSKKSIAYGVFVAGADVYVAGMESTPTSQYYAKLWKNGTLISLSSNPSMAFQVVVAGNDVYVAGQENYNQNGYATYWKNGSAVALSSGTVGSLAHSIFIDGNDVYVAGVEIKNGVSLATVWKNGVPTTLGINASFAYSVFVDGGDVYVVGDEELPGGSRTAKYWKNGNATSLSSANSTATSVFIR